jgi:hypothetical protein
MMRNLQECISLLTIRIHPQFDEVITALKSAQSKEGDQYSLDKSKSSNNDLLDGLRLALESVNQ